MKISTTILFVLLILAGCTTTTLNTEEGNLYGEAIEKGMIPCSASSNCDTFDALEVNSQQYFLVKDVQTWNANLGNDYVCNNNVCAIYCANNDCYLQDNNGDTYVNGQIINNPSSADVNLQTYILVQ